jgi:DnaK suppressor protein
MARRDALLRLHERLKGQRDELRRMLGLEMSGSDGGKGGDSGDVANDDAERELNTQLAALESRELLKIEKAIEAIRTGRYGLCEVCDRRIPVTRLNALPYTPFCIECQRKQEASGKRGEDGVGDWAAADEYQSREHDRELTISDIDMSIPG